MKQECETQHDETRPRIIYGITLSYARGVTHQRIYNSEDDMRNSVEFWMRHGAALGVAHVHAWAERSAVH